jgi:hypothetical protein
MFNRCIAFLLVAFATSSLRAQEAFTDGLASSFRPAIVSQPVPNSAWLDLRQNIPAHAKPQIAPNWVEAVSLTPARPKDPNAKSVFRIRVSKPAGDYRLLFLRLFFDDKANAHPELVAWDESGSQILRSGELGSGVELPSSDSVIIPMTNIAAIDIEVPGDGQTVRGAYIDWMTSSEVAHPVHASHRDVIPEPFSSMPPLHAPTQDFEQFGAVRATLSPETIRIGTTLPEGAAFRFGIESEPLLALVTFEVANPRIDTPPNVFVNGQDLGPANLTLPELSDPGFRGQTEAMIKKMNFHYTGWLRAQKMIPADLLKSGSNDIIVVNGGESGTAAIRATQIELKYLWDKSDYLLAPAR